MELGESKGRHMLSFKQAMLQNPTAIPSILPCSLSLSLSLSLLLCAISLTSYILSVFSLSAFWTWTLQESSDSSLLSDTQ